MDIIGRSYMLITPGSQRALSRDEIILFYWILLQENLFDLLSDNEKIDIMETFDLMDTNQGR